MPKLRPKPTPTPSFKDAPMQYRAFAFLIHICNWTKTDAYLACFPNCKSVGQSLNNVASHFSRRQDIQAIIEEIDIHEVQNYIDGKVALIEKNASSFAFARPKPVAQLEQQCDSNNSTEIDMLNMTDDELMANAVKLYYSAINADGQLQAMKLITDLKKKLGAGSENEADTSVSRYYVPFACSECNLYLEKRNTL